MFAKVLLIALIGCTLTFASPVLRNEETPNEATDPAYELQKAVENIIIKVAQAVQKILEVVFNQINQGLNSESLKQSVDQLREILEKAFNPNENEQSPSDQEIQNAVNEAIKNVCEVFKGIFQAFFQKVKEVAHDPELKKSIEELKNILEKIFTHDNQGKNSVNAPRAEEITNLTDREIEKVDEGLRTSLKDLLLQIIENSNEEFTSAEIEEIKNILDKHFSDLNEDEW